MLRLIGAPGIEPSLARQEPSKARPVDPLRALAARAICREEVAERTLLMAVGPAVLATVRRVLGAHHPEVDDVCQEAAIGLLSALPSFRAECTVMHFACRVALLTALAARRRTRREGSFKHEGSEESDDFVEDRPSPAELVDSARRRNVLRRLLDKLPLAQAEVLALHVMLGYTVEETGATIGAPVNTVRSRLRRGLAALRQELDARGNLREIIGAYHEQTE